MPVELEASNAYEDLQVEERRVKVADKKLQRRWLLPVAVMAIALFAVVCFGVGFAVAYFAVSGAGKLLGRDVDSTFIIWDVIFCTFLCSTRRLVKLQLYKIMIGDNCIRS